MSYFTRSRKLFHLEPIDFSTITENLRLITTWTSEDDIDDIIDNINSVIHEKDLREIIKVFRLNYRFMNELLLEYFYNIPNILSVYKKYQSKQTSYIQSYFTYVKNESKESLQKQYIEKAFLIYGRLIVQVQKSFFSEFKTLSEYLENTGQNLRQLSVYRGFDYNRYKLLLDQTVHLNIGDKFKTGCFLSSSLYKSTALRFISQNTDKIAWKINIPYDKFSKFFYSFLSTDSHTFIDKNALGQKEVEFFLNMNMCLQLKNKYMEGDVLFFEWNFIEYCELDKNFEASFMQYIHSILNFLTFKTSIKKSFKTKSNISKKMTSSFKTLKYHGK